MRNAQRIVLTLLIVFVLAGCKTGKKETPTQLDAANQEAQRLTAQAPTITWTPWPTPWPPTATRTPQRKTPTPTPWPTKDPDATEEVVENLSGETLQGDWLLTPFTDDNGQEHTLAEFTGRAVILETVSASCASCVEQQQVFAQAIQDRLNQGVLSDTVFIALGVIPGETPGLIRSVLQDQLGEDWAPIATVLSADTPSDYLFGLASDDLLKALEEAFGSQVLDPEQVNVIVIEKNGLAHPFPVGIVSFRSLRDAITAYANPPEGE
jgi:hypothetical protein